MLRRPLTIVVLLLLAACRGNDSNPFGVSVSHAPSADAVLLFVTGSWATDPGKPREVHSLSADGSKLDRLTSCAQAAQPCDIVRFAASPDHTRIAAIRAVPGSDPTATALYFMDLTRSTEKLLFLHRRVSSVDWSLDGTLLLYSSNGDAVAPEEDLFLCEPNAANDQNITTTPGIRELSPRFDPATSTAAYTRIDENGMSRIYLYQATPVTTGPASGTVLPGTLYQVGGDADPAFSPDATRIVFRRLTDIGNGGLGSWDLMTVNVDGSNPQTLVSGPLYRGAPDWGQSGIVFVETDAGKGQSQLVVMQPDGTGRKVLRTEGAGYGMGAPRWLFGN